MDGAYNGEMKASGFIVAFTQCVLCVTYSACADARQARINLKERASRAKINFHFNFA